MHEKHLIVTKYKWKSRDKKHEAIRKVKMLARDIESVTFDVEHRDVGTPKTYIDSDGLVNIDHQWFEENISRGAKTRGFTHVKFIFSNLDGKAWGIATSHRGNNIGDGDSFGESWIKCDENSVRKYTSTPKTRNLYETDFLHEDGHEYKRQGLSNLEVHDFDFQNTKNHIEEFYRLLDIKPMANTLSLMRRLVDLLQLEKLLIMQKDMQGLQPLVYRRVQILMREMDLLGLPVRMVEGYRSIERQNALYAQGRTKPGAIVTNAKGGESMHNYGVAADFVFRNYGYNASEAQWQALGSVARKLGFEWGGDWKDFVDRPHVQLTLSYTLSDFKKGKVDYQKFK